MTSEAPLRLQGQYKRPWFCSCSLQETCGYRPESSAPLRGMAMEARL